MVETAQIAGSGLQFLRGAFFLRWLPVAPSIRDKPGKEKPVLLGNRQPCECVGSPLPVGAVAARAIDQAMRDQLRDCIFDRVF